MAFFDELGKKISVTGQNVMQKAKGMADITSLKSQINEEQKKIDKYCQNLGHMFYELKQNNPEPQLAELVRMVQASYQRIEAIRSEIEAIESIKTCPRCGAVLEPGMAFCVGWNAGFAAASEVLHKVWKTDSARGSFLHKVRNKTRIKKICPQS